MFKKSFSGLSLLLFCTSGLTAMADDAHTEHLQVHGKRKSESAQAQAPGQTPMTATQPETSISKTYIKHIASPHADYLSVMQFSPSASNSSPNGPGMSSKNAAIRGFQDGQYNVTFDGIPFADPSSFSHQTTSFFPAPVLGSMMIDRGPGTASTMGNATFGGTMALNSEDLLDKHLITINGAYGSANTYQAGIDLQSGAIAATNGTRILFNYNHTATDGLLKYAGLRQDNYFLKIEQPIYDFAHFSVVSERTTVAWNNYVQPTVAGTQKYGYNYASLNNDPTSQLYRSYNFSNRWSDFSYAKFDAEKYGFRFVDKAYTYGYDEAATAGGNTNGTTPNSTLLTSGVPGVGSGSHYRPWGNIATLERDFGHGVTNVTARAGVWYDYSRQTQVQVTNDLSTGQIKPYKGRSTALSYDLLGYTTSINSFLEFVWRPVKGLSITPGWKHVDFKRSINGVSSGSTLNSTRSYAVDLGSAALNYQFNQHWAYYAQWAMGFQAPPSNVQRGPGAQFNTLSPQQTINYQTGIIFKSDRFIADIDGYYINFRNKISAFALPVGPGGSYVTVYGNQGGVIYKGFEAEATLRAGYGFSVTANASINSAADKTSGMQVANAPSSTAFFGVLYDRDALYGSFLTKYVGHRFAGAGQLPSGANYTRLPAYSSTDLTLGYRFGSKYRVQFQVANIFDNRTITEGNGSATLPTYYYLPPRNYYGSFSASF
ncbi:TonB-dependent receptor [Neokomagataea anthophila]|uniref:TonB-dependent receptor n=1 Tax=Neokomagataea anthophila TaxID=2826925 RepID=A0ABS5E3S9_9PROT|nr:TonB-dependent receptor [Neokomagataea anthophila]MBR0558550.1 TonB-dependent receptor [Neokomagataea anthophila]